MAINHTQEEIISKRKYSPDTKGDQYSKYLE